jgi:hypothetical protein
MGPRPDPQEEREVALTSPELVTPRSAPVRRPIPVTILALIQFIDGAAFLVVAVVLVTDPASVYRAIQNFAGGQLTTIAQLPQAMAIAIAVAVALAYVVAGILLLRMRQLGWTITMLLAGFGLAIGIGAWWTTGVTNSPPLLVQVVTVFYLNLRQVKETFRIARPAAAGALGPLG